ncbi:hypothetical protein [Nocardia sp. NPDC058497]|uniref:hypothetical protein n=1 Tax=Nocardia sp. NPDC058497 TaxID=3346529 RepID=UPI00364B4945
MRRTLLALSVLCPLVGAGLAAADPAPPGTSAAGTLTVRAITGREPIPVNRAEITLTRCGESKVVTTLTSGADGRATVALPDGCYEAKVITVPGGCALADVEPVRLEVARGTKVGTEFRFRCA